jgi:glycerol-3-phosphate dehydrogenase
VLDADGNAPALSVIGGKITTYRRLAEQALEKLAPYLGPLPAPWTAGSALPGGDIPGGDVEQLALSLQRLYPFLEGGRARRIARAYGTRALRWLDGARSARDLGEDFGGGLTRREVDYLVREEWARSAEDVYWRHSKTGLAASAGDRARLDDWFAARFSSGAAASAT